MWAASALATKFPTSLDCQSLKAGLVLGCAGFARRMFLPLWPAFARFFWPFSVGKALIRLLPCVNWTHTDQNQSEVGHSLRSHRHGRPRTFQVQSRSSQTLLVCLLACLFIYLFLRIFIDWSIDWLFASFSLLLPACGGSLGSRREYNRDAVKATCLGDICQSSVCEMSL